MGHLFSSLILSVLLTSSLLAVAVPAKAAPPPPPPWDPACHSVVLVYRDQDKNGVYTTTLESQLKSSVNGTACLALKKWDLYVDANQVDLVATQAANPGIIISYTGHLITLRMGFNQPAGTNKMVKLVGTGTVNIGDAYVSWAEPQGSSNGQVVADISNVVNVADPRLVAPDHVALFDSISGFSNESVALSRNSPLEATHGVTFDPNNNSVNVNLYLAPDYGSFLPPIPLINNDPNGEIYGGVTMEMDSQDNVHLFMLRASSPDPDASLRAYLLSTDAFGNPLRPPAPIAPIFDDFGQLYIDSEIDAQDRLHVVFSVIADEAAALAYFRSEDGGATWTDPSLVDFCKPENPGEVSRQLVPSMAVSPDGSKVVVSYFKCGSIEVAKSEDGGMSFPVKSTIATPSSFEIVTGLSRVALDPEGHILVSIAKIWNRFVNNGEDAPDGVLGPQPISPRFVWFSSEDGVSYNEIFSLNSKASEPHFQGDYFLPFHNMAIDNLGRIDLNWQSVSISEGAGTTAHYYHARSANGGLGFGPTYKTAAFTGESVNIYPRGSRHDKDGELLFQYMRVPDSETLFAEIVAGHATRGHCGPSGCQAPCGDGFCSVLAGEDLNTCLPDCIQCGDRICSAGEDSSNCPNDCPVCGDHYCSSLEDIESCVTDCYICGDGVCSEAETVGDAYPNPPSPNACHADCGSCGNGQCNPFEEDYNSCPQDTCTCGNGICGDSPSNMFPPRFENTITCPSDCGAAFCGNGACELDAGENALTCLEDCHCGNSICEESLGEFFGNCPGDCTLLCGDDVCDPGEVSNCPGDCGSSCDLDGICESPNETENNCRDCTCGDGSCAAGAPWFEDSDNCPVDCGISCSDHPFVGDPNGASCETNADCRESFAGLPQGFLDSLVCQGSCCTGPAICDPQSPLGDTSCITNGGDEYCANSVGFAGFTECNMASGCCQVPIPPSCGDGTCDPGEDSNSCPADCSGTCGELGGTVPGGLSCSDDAFCQDYFINNGIFPPEQAALLICNNGCCDGPAVCNDTGGPLGTVSCTTQVPDYCQSFASGFGATATCREAESCCEIQF